jgi:ribonuclease P protein component
MRCGWTLPRQVGSAVVRNRLKRWSRVYFRNRLKEGQKLPADINLVFRKAEGDFYKKLSYERFADVVDKSLQQLERKLQRNGADSSSPPARSVPDNRNNSPRR